MVNNKTNNKLRNQIEAQLANTQRIKVSSQVVAGQQPNEEIISDHNNNNMLLSSPLMISPQITSALDYNDMDQDIVEHQFNTSTIVAPPLQIDGKSLLQGSNLQ